MSFNTHIESDYLEMVELTEEIGAIVQKSINEGNENLSAADVEYILKITFNVTKKIRSHVLELTV